MVTPYAGALAPISFLIKFDASSDASRRCSIHQLGIQAGIHGNAGLLALTPGAQKSLSSPGNVSQHVSLYILEMIKAIHFNSLSIKDR
jgi:hypothetical protein